MIGLFLDLKIENPIISSERTRSTAFQRPKIIMWKWLYEIIPREPNFTLNEFKCVIFSPKSQEKLAKFSIFAQKLPTHWQGSAQVDNFSPVLPVLVPKFTLLNNFWDEVHYSKLFVEAMIFSALWNNFWNILFWPQEIVDHARCAWFLCEPVSTNWSHSLDPKLYLELIFFSWEKLHSFFA